MSISVSKSNRPKRAAKRHIHEPLRFDDWVLQHCKVHVEHADLTLKVRTSKGMYERIQLRTSSGWAWITFAMLSRVNVSSRKRRLISIKTSSCAGFVSSRTFLSARYEGPRRLQKCCAKIQPQSAVLSEKYILKKFMGIRTSVSSVLHGMAIILRSGEEGVVRKTVEKRDFFHDLED